MRYKGNKISANIEYIILPRGEGEDIVLKATAIMDMEAFRRACPYPKPPVGKRPNDETFELVDDPNYLLAIEEFSQKRIAWMILKSLENDKNIEFERAKLADPSTWLLWIEELKESNFSEIEIQRIQNGCMAAQSLSDAKMAEARARFLAMNALQLDKQLSQKGEH